MPIGIGQYLIIIISTAFVLLVVQLHLLFLFKILRKKVQLFSGKLRSPEARKRAAILTVRTYDQ